MVVGINSEATVLMITIERRLGRRRDLQLTPMIANLKTMKRGWLRIRKRTHADLGVLVGGGFVSGIKVELEMALGFHPHEAVPLADLISVLIFEEPDQVLMTARVLNA